jgi:DNA polymerase
MTDPGKLSTLFEHLEGTLRYLADSGVSGIHCRPETLDIVQSWAMPKKVHASEKQGGALESQALEPNDGTGQLEAVRLALGDCTRCRLSETRRHIVFGEGNPKARLLFVGEGPGRDEDIQGRPFVGAAGQLLTKIIQAMGLSRKEVYIANIIKCRPPQNRNPLPEEIETCFPFLQRQIDAIRPEVICALGKFAAQTLLQTETPISRLRGRFHDYRGTALMPTFHPAYLLRNAERKRDTWQDVQKIMAQLGLELQKPGKQG